jgi:hypothetical protein
MRGIERTVRFSFLLVIFFALRLPAQYLNNPDVRYVVQSGLWNMLVNANSETSRYAKILREHFPDYPFAYILPVLNKLAIDNDNGQEASLSEMGGNLSKAREIADSLLGQNRSAENYFYLGMAKAISAYEKFLHKDYVGAFFKGVSALSEFNNCLALDSSFAAAEVAIGAYKYWSSEKMRSLDWLPFITDEREAGIRLLRKGLAKDNILYHFGLESLIWIYIHQKKFESAKQLSLRALEKYPNSRFFLYALAHAYNKLDKEKANKIFRKIVSLREHDGINSVYWRVVLLHKIAMNEYALGNYAKARELCEKILAVKLKPSDFERLASRIKRVEQLRAKIVKKVGNN